MESQSESPCIVSRSRGPNFNKDEVELLVQLATFEKLVIENKKTDAVTSLEKEAAWERVARQFNAQSVHRTFRSKESLKKLYENKKKNLRKEAANLRYEAYKTGGGPCEKVMKTEDNLLLDLLNNKTVEGMKNPFDSNAELDTNINTQTQETIILTPVFEIDDSQDLDWGDLKAVHLRSRVNEKLRKSSSVRDAMKDLDSDDITDVNIFADFDPKSNSTLSEPRLKSKVPDSEAGANKSKPTLPIVAEDLPYTDTGTNFHKRRRPVISNLHASHISKQYDDLAKIKIEMASCELENVKRN